MISSPDYPPRTLGVVSTPAEQVVRLRIGSDKAIALRVHVAEVGSGRSVAGAEILQKLSYRTGPKPWGTSGADGVFQGELQAKDFEEGVGQVFGISVRAEGYSLWTKENCYFHDGDQELTVTLKKARAPAGTVLLPSGQPATDAKVILNTGESSVYSYQPGRFDPNGSGFETMRTGDDGSFRFKSAANENQLLITHAAGVASLTVAELGATGRVTLQPWATLSGVLRYAGKPLSSQDVGVKWPLSWMGVESHHIMYRTQTDRQGRFVFTNLPPGEYLLFRSPRSFMYRETTESQLRFVQVKAGETNRVDYELGGRTVTGHVDGGGDVDWKNDPHYLVLKLPPRPTEPNFRGFAAPGDYRAQRRAFARSPATLAYERKRQQVLLSFDNDGNFQADDVLPGVYEMRLRVTKPLTSNERNRFNGNLEEMGKLMKEVKVPAGAAGTEVDLGNFEMTLRLPNAGPSAPLTLRATTLEGKPFDLAALRGQPVVLIFWANWAPRSAPVLTELHALAEQRAAFVTINLDEDAEAARRSVAGLEKEWTHLRLEGLPRVELTEQLGVDTLPMTLLLNRDGAVAARDVRGKRLSAAVERLVRQTAKK